ncbi:MAG: 1,2-phenylacetyl-CoA epoxidase subunit PaaD [Paracoccaceae bacterium]
MSKPTINQIWEWLDSVPDPEIPVISVVDLGIVRDVNWDLDMLEVSVTPTYSGCPATTVISRDIEAALRDRGVKKVRIKTKISPAWTTDWLSKKGRLNLEKYGIATPQATGRPAHCPRCKSENVEKVSQFGSTPCKAQWRCTDCLEPFDYFKCI